MTGRFKGCDSRKITLWDDVPYTHTPTVDTKSSPLPPAPVAAAEAKNSVLKPK